MPSSLPFTSSSKSSSSSSSHLDGDRDNGGATRRLPLQVASTADSTASAAAAAAALPPQQSLSSSSLPSFSASSSRRSKSLSSPSDTTPGMMLSVRSSAALGSTPLSVLPEDEDGTSLDAKGNVITASSSTYASSQAPATTSPSTPPKKVWERSYKNFLKLRGSNSSSSGSGGSHGRNSAAATNPPAASLLAPIPPPLIPPHRRAQSTSSAMTTTTTTGSYTNSTAPSSASTAAATALHATLTSNSNSNSIPMTSTSTVTEPKSEGSVRGGKLFANMFHSHHSNANNSRKAKSLSADELDGTLRRGTGKGSYSDAYSPGSNHRQVPSTPPLTTTTITAAATVSTAAAAPAIAAVASLPASLRSRDGAPRPVTTLLPRSEDDNTYMSSHMSSPHSPRVVIVQEDGGGTALSSPPPPPVDPNKPTSSSGSSRSDSAMKKAFTEFHNSSSTGRDAVSAFLGDEPSHRGIGVSGTKGKDGGKSSDGSSGGGAGSGSGRAHHAGPGHSLAWTSSHHHALSTRGASAMGSKLYASMVDLPRVLSTDNHAQTATAAASAVVPPPTALPPLAPSPGRAITTGTIESISRPGRGDTVVDAKLASLALLSQTAPAHPAVSSFPSGSTGLVKVPSYFHVSPPVDSAHLTRKNVRVLKPIQSVDVWQPNRRYLIAPAALAACPLHVLPTLAPGPSQTAAQVHERGLRAGEFCSPFGTVVLGRCWMASTPRTLALPSGGRLAVPTPPAALTTAWSEGVLVLRQNYLLEYVPDEYHPRATPRGYAHLQYAVCKDQDDDKDEFRHHVIRLEFFGSPCAKSDPRTLHIQLHDASHRRAWKWCLNRAAQLTIQDLYLYRPNDASGSSVLGKGSYSTVYAACRQGEQMDRNGVTDGPSAPSLPRHTCALKIFDKSLYWKMVVKGRERADTLVRETSVQATMTAKCGRVSSFVKIRGFFETADHVVLELELLEGGTDLFKYVSARGVLKESRAAEILHDMLVALQAMNRIGLAHRDVKPANVLMLPSGAKSASASSGSMPSCKIADFGMSTFVGVDGQLRGRCGTPGFVAPEIFTAGVHGGYGNKVDVFSAGVTLYVMLCGYEPFYGESDAELIAANRAALIDFPDDEWKGVSAEAKDLVRQMMHPDPRHRLSPSQALQHKWLDEARRRSGNIDLDRSTTLPSTEAPSDDACTIM